MPSLDEVEVSVFGRGYGEAVCLHLGAGEWIVVDSCLEPDSGQPAALNYLRTIGLNPDEAVKLVLVTHWDDDHIGGIATIVETCSHATVVCSAALGKDDVLQFVIEQEGAGGALGSGVDELRSLLRLAKPRGGVVWAKANLPLHPRPPGEMSRVVALAPSENAVERSIEELIRRATELPPVLRRRYTAPEGPNGASVAAVAYCEDTAILLGADLEKSNNPETGWEAVVSYARPTSAASLVKVPHHGSEGAHHEGVWTGMVEGDPVGVLTPWSMGDKFLPTERDLVRLRAITDRLYLTAMPSLARARKDPEVEKLIRRLHGGRLDELRGWGHVRARWRQANGRWSVDLEGDAVAA